MINRAALKQDFGRGCIMTEHVTLVQLVDEGLHEIYMTSKLHQYRLSQLKAEKRLYSQQQVLKFKVKIKVFYLLFKVTIPIRQHPCIPQPNIKQYVSMSDM